jgi:hypothetical protein
MSYRHVVYECPEAPDSMSFIAYTLVSGRKGEHRIAVAFPAPTRERALAACSEAWEAEMARMREKEAAAIRRGSGKPAAPAPKRPAQTPAASPSTAQPETPAEAPSVFD